VDQNPPASPALAAGAVPSPAPASSVDAAVLYAVAFVAGAIVMGFEMLGSRYLNPFFGSGIYTWAALISTVLTALTVGYFLGGALADRAPSIPVLAATVLVASAYLLVLPAFSGIILDFVLTHIDDIRTGSLVAAFAIMFFPVTLFGMYSPFAIRLLLRSPLNSGRVSGTVYAVSTAGSIVGTLGTTFFLIPAIGSRAITLTLGAAGIASGLALLLHARLARKAATAGLCVLVVALTATAGRADGVIDDAIRMKMLKRADGRIAHLETEYNDIFITKRGGRLTMSFQLKGWDYTESVINLADADDLPLRYTQVMTVALAYPETPKSILMLGLGGGSIPVYLGRFMPEATITTVEIDPGVITAAKTYFGLRETPRMRYRDGDARVFLNRHADRYDLILVDAYRGGYVPVHLLTREFYTLLKQRLTPGGAVAFNVHDGSKLYAATVRTLSEVFPGLDLYPTGLGEVIAVATAGPAPDKDTLAARAQKLQERHGFRFRLPEMMKRRLDKLPSTAGAELITDDFAPADIYDVMGDRPRKRK
jgi:spermidine synthase